MIRLPNFVKYCLVILSLGGIYKTIQISPNSSIVRSIEDYWAKTELSSGELESLISNQNCSSSERYFLACANSIISVASRFNLQINFRGELFTLDNQSKPFQTEKQQLEPWKTFIDSDNSNMQKVSFLDIWVKLKTNYISKAKLQFMIATGMNGFISVFRDPHTYLLPISYYREVVAKTDNKSVSLGILLGRKENKYFIRKIQSGTPAEKAGLEKGDIIFSIEGSKISSLLPARVGELMRGEIGKKIKLEIIRNEKRHTINILREPSLIPTVSKKVTQGNKPIGIVSINKFSKNTCQKTKEILAELQKDQIQGLLLDLRDNPGGQMEEAACVASLFVGKEKKIFEIKYIDNLRENEIAFGTENQVYDGPMAIIINAGSASAAEIVAGALHDLNRAILVGEQSFGKGSFQEGEVWGQNKEIAIFETKGFYYLPSGKSPQLNGLQPDVKVDFKDTLQVREVDQFINPLHAPLLKNYEKIAIFKSKKRNMNSCLDLQDSQIELDDLQLDKAKQTLFCINNLAGVPQ